jgi:hypothetical protein
VIGGLDKSTLCVIVKLHAYHSYHDASLSKYSTMFTANKKKPKTASSQTLISLGSGLRLKHSVNVQHSHSLQLHILPDSTVGHPDFTIPESP